MLQLHANGPQLLATTRARHAHPLSRAERRGHLHVAQTQYADLVATVWGTGYLLRVTPEAYKHHFRPALQVVWRRLAYWRRMVAEAEQEQPHCGSR